MVTATSNVQILTHFNFGTSDVADINKNSNLRRQTRHGLEARNGVFFEFYDFFFNYLF